MTAVGWSTRSTAFPSFMEGRLYLHPVLTKAMTGLHRRSPFPRTKATGLVTGSGHCVHHEEVDNLTDVPDLQRTFIAELSMFVSDLDDNMVKPLLRKDSDDPGVVVILPKAPRAPKRSVDTGVQSGDIIRAVNRTALQSVSQLQATVRGLKSGDPVVLQVERGGKLQYLAFEMD